MVKVTFVAADDSSRITVDGAEGDTLMRTAIENGLPGIDAMCGGACSCATCQVYVDEAWLPKLDEADELEGMVLELVEDRQRNSRLSCQIFLSAALDGIVVKVPEAQS